MEHYQNFTDTQYQGLLRTLLMTGIKKSSRTGVDCLSVFGANIKINLQDGFPLLTTKRMAWNQIVTELKWFLKGDTNIKYLVENNCHIWNDDAYKKYVRVCDYDLDKPMSKKEFIDLIKKDKGFANVWGELGPIYGSQWRYWPVEETRIGDDEDQYYGIIDQIRNLIEGLKKDPNSRRHIVSAWNVSDISLMALPPCHYSFQCYVRDEKYLDLLWNQRSADTFLGIPFNIASYALLTHMIAKEVNLEPGNLIGNIGDLHLYMNHVEQAKDQLVRKPYKLPEINIKSQNILNGEVDVELIDYNYHPTLKAKLNT